MKALEILSAEHDLIRKALDSLSLAKEKLEGGERPPTAVFKNAVEFARSFVLKFHHFKEEYLMFARLAQKEDGKIDSQIESLRYQHERGREYVNGIADSLDGYAVGKAIQTSALLENVAAYVSLLRQHIHREDHIFYPMVDKALSDEEKTSLLKEFEKEEEKAGVHPLKNAEKLVKEMGALLQ